MPPQPQDSACSLVAVSRPLPSLDVVPLTLSPDVARLVAVLAQIERRRQLRLQLASTAAWQEAS